MKCCRCPLYTFWSNESDRGESCGLFGDAWDSRFQYEDKIGNIEGCYIDPHFIKQADEKYYSKYLEQCADEWLEDAPDTDVGRKPEMEETEKNDCTTCKHGGYNDHWETFFCYVDEKCTHWNLWEPKEGET